MNNVGISPDYERKEQWESYAKELRTEYRQLLDEGRDAEPYRELFEAVSGMPNAEYKFRIADVLSELAQNLPMRDGYAYREPSDWAGIWALCAGRTDAEKKPVPADDALGDRILGAWLGRICGCLLGKPIEGIRTEELWPLLQASGNWPLRRYILSTDITEEQKKRASFPLASRVYPDQMECAPSDDDTNYTVLMQELIERCGRDFTPEDVMEIWLGRQSRYAYCTAERVAYCNAIKGYRPPATALFQNPYREWIGAQIRADYFGYINPGNPGKAAEMAWRDASISHIKNGIYGEMLVAAMLAQAAVETDIESVVETGMRFIPATSRLYEAISGVLADFRAGVVQGEAFSKIHRAYDEHTDYGWCHTIPNAMIVVAALLYGAGDYGKSICMAVETGFDTDCNGATVGSIVGMLKGSGAIGADWAAPVNGMLDTTIFGVSRVRIQDCADRTMRHIRRS